MCNQTPLSSYILKVRFISCVSIKETMVMPTIPPANLYIEDSALQENTGVLVFIGNRLYVEILNKNIENTTQMACHKKNALIVGESQIKTPTVPSPLKVDTTIKITFCTTCFCNPLRQLEYKLSIKFNATITPINTNADVISSFSNLQHIQIPDSHSDPAKTMLTIITATIRVIISIVRSKS